MRCMYSLAGMHDLAREIEAVILFASALPASAFLSSPRPPPPPCRVLPSHPSVFSERPLFILPLLLSFCGNLVHPGPVASLLSLC